MRSGAVIRDLWQWHLPRVRDAFGRIGVAEGDLPTFRTNNECWRVEQIGKRTRIGVSTGASAYRGNLVWHDLAAPLKGKTAYRVTLRWAVRTGARSISMHVRNGKTGKYRGVGRIPVRGHTNAFRVDKVDFITPSDGFDQIMFGATHFTGASAGADISSIHVEEISVSDIETNGILPTSPAETVKEFVSKDSDRYISTYAQNMAARNTGNARAIMMFHAHAIEKGLSHSDFRPGFGKISVPGLAREMNRWLAAGRDPEDTFFKISASVMHAYFARHEALGVDVSKFRELFDAPIMVFITQTDESDGGVLSANKERELRVASNGSRDFLDVVFARRSVREFTRAPVADEDIQRAVQVAMQAPSVCNRQGPRVHLFEDPALIRPAVKLQGGFGGYKMPPRLLLVTCDLKAYLFAAERNQPFIDGGLFMMSLLLGIEQSGLGSCSLNTAMGPDRESKIRKLLKIPESEVFISFVAVGHFDPAVLTPRSKRVPVEEVLVRHG